MKALSPHHLTRALWAANGLSLLLIVAIVLVRLGAIVFGSPVRLPDIEALTPSAMPPLPSLEMNASRNPFDPSGGVWKEPKAEGGGDTGELKGILLLPGVHRLLTGRGPVKPGEMVDQGKVLDMTKQGIKIQTQDGTTTLELPGAHRPHLEDLNRAAPRGKHQEQGKP